MTGICHTFFYLQTLISINSQQYSQKITYKAFILKLNDMIKKTKINFFLVLVSQYFVKIKIFHKGFNLRSLYCLMSHKHIKQNVFILILILNISLLDKLTNLL